MVIVHAHLKSPIAGNIMKSKSGFWQLFWSTCNECGMIIGSTTKKTLAENALVTKPSSCLKPCLQRRAQTAIPSDLGWQGCSSILDTAALGETLPQKALFKHIPPCLQLSRGQAYGFPQHFPQFKWQFWPCTPFPDKHDIVGETYTTIYCTRIYIYAS